MSPARDTYYKAMAEDVERDLAEQERVSPRAYALRTQLVDLYHREPIGSTTAEMALRVVDYLNALIAERRDIDLAHECNLRGCLNLGQPR